MHKANPIPTGVVRHPIEVRFERLGQYTRPCHAEWQPERKNIWVSSEVGGNVSFIDGETFEIANVINFDIPGVSPEQIQPVGMRFSADGKKAYVALGPANRVAEVNTDTFDVKDYVLEGQRPWHVEIAPTTSRSSIWRRSSRISRSPSEVCPGASHYALTLS